MRRLIALSLLVGCGGAPHPKPAAAPAVEIPVVMQPSASPIVELRVVFRAGSAFDPEGKAGLGHLTATVMAEGGTPDLTYEQLLETLHPWAATIAAQVDKEQVVFIGRCHRDHLSAFYPIFRDVLLTPRLAAADVERVRLSTLETLTKSVRTGDDEALSKLVLEWALWRDHPYGHPIVGTEAGLKAITRDDVVAHRQAVLTQDRLTLGLAGAADEALAARMKADFARLPATSAPPTIPPALAASPRLIIVEQPDARATAISIGHLLSTTRAHPDFPALRLMSSDFGEHRQFHGVLFQTMREQRGMNYGDYAYVEAYRQEGWGRMPLVNIARSQHAFSIWIRPVSHDDKLFALRIAQWNLARLLESGLSGEAFAKTRGFLDGYIFLGQLSDQRRLGTAIDDRFYGLSERYLDTMRAGWGALSVEQVNAALRRHIQPGQLTTVVITQDAQAYADAVVAGAPSPKAYASPKPAAITAEDAEIATRDVGYGADQITILQSAELFAR